MITLDILPLGHSCRVSDLSAQGHLRQRFFDLGIIRDTEIKALFESPAGDPRAYSVRGATIALRNFDAHKIIVKTI